MKQPYEAVSILLDRADIEYLSTLLWTIERDKELNARFILKGNRLAKSSKSNYYRVRFKLDEIRAWYNPRYKMPVIANKPQ